MPEESLAEQFVIGACLLSPEAIRFAEAVITPEDFYRPSLETAFHVICEMRKAGNPIDPYTVSVKLSEIRASGGLDAATLHHIMSITPSAGSVEYYATQVRDASVRRAIRATGQKLIQQSGEDFNPPAKTVTDALESLKSIRDNTPGRTVQAKTLREVYAESDEYDWIVEGLLERGDRMIITGAEGFGKTTWIRQMAILFAAGVNPITLDYLPRPVRVLVVDVENREVQWRRETRAIAMKAAQHGKDPRDLLRLHCTGRLDLTKDRDLSMVHGLVDLHDPEILFIGPVYKLTPRGINGDDEAAPLITALDSLHDRGLAMIMEAHSPKGSAGERRDLTPRGSAALMGWPEFGFGLAPGGANTADVVRWRGDRDRKRHWPTKLHMGGPFPWTADNVAPNIRRQFYDNQPPERY